MTVISDEAEFLPGLSLHDYLRFMDRFPRFRDVIIPDGRALEAVLSTLHRGNEFDGDLTGRGDSYRQSQQLPCVRLTGIRALLELALDRCLTSDVPDDFRLLDVLGGDGTIARAVASLSPPGAEHWVLTGDLSRHMVAGALGYGLPALCQPAQRLLLRDETFDAVVIAYGTHHIPPAERILAYSEAYRVLRPGGRIVVHDFEKGGKMDAWFTEVVHRHAPNGHAHEHISRADLADDLATSGFAVTSIDELYDPFEVPGLTPGAARQKLTGYVADMYGLFGLTSSPEWADRVWELMDRHLTYESHELPVTSPSVRPAAGGHVATLPRVALVGVGVKPA